MPLNRIIAILMIMIFCCQIFDRSIITLDFYVNQNYIAKNLCENRDKPQLHCDGKCQLCKKLKQEDNKDKQNGAQQKENRVEVLSSKTFFAEINIPFSTRIKQSYFLKNTNFVIDQSYPFFHPPQCFFV